MELGDYGTTIDNSIEKSAVDSDGARDGFLQAYNLRRFLLRNIDVHL